MVFKNMYIALKTARQKSVTRLYPEKVIEFPSSYRGLHNIDPARCTGCGICAQNCPNKCIEIVHEKEEVKTGLPLLRLFPKIDVGHCMFCGICLEVCPEDALSWSRAFELAAWTRDDTIYSPAKLIASHRRER